ncbi:hypothetical protein KQX54_021061 [Cotesia glomerata]|uniref:Uncharacterized protein n=1 Tax=Cotesia glomerata TaxID=32391 RepID=A0AAV7I1V1_COTGL|nr:hypothetical protein KQX54_021061 [Cotesia glomerata]
MVIAVNGSVGCFQWDYEIETGSRDNPIGWETNPRLRLTGFQTINSGAGIFDVCRHTSKIIPVEDVQLSLGAHKLIPRQGKTPGLRLTEGKSHPMVKPIKSHASRISRAVWMIFKSPVQLFVN